MLLFFPVFVELAMVSFDAFWAHWMHAEMWNVAFGAVREVAMGNVVAELQGPSIQSLVEEWVHAQLGGGYAVVYAETASHHTVTISADSNRMSLFGSLIDGLNSLEASVTLAREP